MTIDDYRPAIPPPRVASVPVTVAIPTIPPRGGPGGLLYQAYESVAAQTIHPLGGISVALDTDHAGAAATRQRALGAVRTEWVAFMDDDDLWYPNHIATLWGLAERTGAWFVWSWFDGNDPFPMHRGRQMDLSSWPESMHHTTMTVMVRTELAKEVGFTADNPEGWDLPQEDWRFITGCAKVLIDRYGVEEAQKLFAGSPEVTWHYRYHGANTSGLGDRW